MLHLVYTSAPRLLDAGKTGFGVVAATRGMPRPLISYLERISAFDRAAAVSSLQFYSTYRMGSALFHVFSRVGDCGADYTGRTNHLAEHFVVEHGTAEHAALASTTPAALMLALQGQWLSRWDVQPERMGETALPAQVLQVSAGSWRKVTGDEGNARWLASSHLVTPCSLQLPAGVDEVAALRLLHDGMLQRTDYGWGCGFSTAVVSTLSGLTFRCLRDSQQRAGIQPEREPQLVLAMGMSPPPAEPAVAAIPLPEELSMASSPLVEEITPAEEIPIITEVPHPSAPTSFAPLPAWSEASVMPAAQAMPAEKRSPASRRKKEEKTPAHYTGIVVVVIGMLLGAFWWNSQKDGSPSPSRKTSEPAAVSPQNDTGKESATKKKEAPKPEEKPKAAETPKPEEKPKAAEASKPEEKPKATEAPKPEEDPKATEAPKPEEDPKATETPKPEEEPKATETPKPEEEPKSEAPHKPADSPKSSEEKILKVTGKAVLHGSKNRTSPKWNKTVSFKLRYDACRSKLGIAHDSANIYIADCSELAECSAMDLPLDGSIEIHVKQPIHRSCYLKVEKIREEGINVDIAVKVMSIDWIEEALIQEAREKKTLCEDKEATLKSDKEEAEKALEKPEAELLDARKKNDKEKIKKLEDEISKLQSKIGKARKKYRAAQEALRRAEGELNNLEKLQEIYKKEHLDFNDDGK